LHDGNKVADELAKLDSSRAMITPEVFIQELNKPSISRTLAKASKMAEWSEETIPLADDKPESSNVMMVHLD
jgi:hypothetical protein